jgi:ABC-type phosphate transport system permease subunit
MPSVAVERVALLLRIQEFCVNILAMIPAIVTGVVRDFFSSPGK